MNYMTVSAPAIGIVLDCTDPVRALRKPVRYCSANADQ